MFDRLKSHGSIVLHYLLYASGIELYEFTFQYNWRINHLIVAFISLLLLFSACHILNWAFKLGESYITL